MTSPGTLEGALRGSRLVSIALLLGQVTFAVIIGVVLDKGMFDPAADETMTSWFQTFGIVAGALSLPAAFVLRKLLWNKGAGTDDSRLAHAYFAGNVAFQAVLEGAGLLNLTFWLITGQTLPFVGVFAVLFVLGAVTLVRAPTP